MADNRTARAVWIVLRAAAVAALIAAVILLAFVAPSASTQQRYPDRKPVRYWHMWTAEWKEVVDRIVERFNESQDEYEVIALSVPAGIGISQANTKFLMGVVGGDPPDLMTQWNSVIPAWASKGLLVPLDEQMTPEEWETFQQTAYPVAQRIGTFRGHLYGVTTGLNMFACYYHPSHLLEEGLDPDNFPTTLEKLSEWGDRLNRFDQQGQLTRIGFMARDWPGLKSFAPLFGGGFYDWANDKLTLNTPENLAALEYLAGRRHKLGFENVLRFEEGLTSGESGLAWPFLQEAFSIALDGQWRVEQLAKYAPDLEYQTASVPAPSKGVPLSGFANGNFMIIPKGAKNIPGAMKFMRFWSGLDEPERAAEFYTWGGWLPLSPAIANAPAYKEYVREFPQFQTFVDMMEGKGMQPLPPVPYQLFLDNRIGNIQDLTMRGTLTPAEGLEKLEEDVERELVRRKELGHVN